MTRIEFISRAEQAVTLREMGYSISEIARMMGVKGNVNSYLKNAHQKNVSPKILTPEEKNAIFRVYGDPKAPKCVMEL